jgi:hypothetical protein
MNAFLVRVAAGAGLAIALQAPLHAAPADPAHDPLTALLIERGVLSAATGDKVLDLRERAADLTLAAVNFIGTPYRWGGTSADDGFDCSGFTRHVFELALGLVLPRRSDEQARAAGLQPVARDQLEPGDLVFFNTLRRSFSHVGIYIGDGRFVHAPRRGAAVRIESLQGPYWAKRYNGARRATLDGAVALAAPAARSGVDSDRP